MDSQTAFNILVALVGALGSWVVKSITDNVKALQRADADIATKMQSIEVLVAGQYIKRDDMEKHMDKLSTALFAKLDKIDDKLDTKADK